MTAINLDDQLVGSTFDPATRICAYTYQHSDGSRYTVEIGMDDLHKIGTTPASREQRRNFLASKIMNHIRSNPPDVDLKAS